MVSDKSEVEMWVLTHIIKPRWDARGYRPIEVLNSATAFAGQELWPGNHRHVYVRLTGHEVYFQIFIAGGKPRARKTGGGWKFSVARYIDRDVDI
jgi:hypothetical protein